MLSSQLSSSPAIAAFNLAFSYIVISTTSLGFLSREGAVFVLLDEGSHVEHRRRQIYRQLEGEHAAAALTAPHLALTI
jgi:hypothetical protein